jgi:hypothetical protein
MKFIDFRRKRHEPGGSLPDAGYISELAFFTANRKISAEYDQDAIRGPLSKKRQKFTPEAVRRSF